MRKLKVTAKAAGYNARKRPIINPCIHLSGKYLLNLGFNIGDVVEITPAGDGAVNIRRATNGL